MSCPPGMRGCAATCGHRSFVDGYRQERQRQEILAEEASLGYAEELRDHLRSNPLPTFKDWLVQTKREPMPEPEPPADLSHQFMRFATEGEANEASLLAIAMNSEEGVSVLRELSIDSEFTSPFHAAAAHAVLDLADQGQPHDAQATTDLLRTRHQLPVGWDPSEVMRTVEPGRYGLAAWQSHALPGDSAGSFARDIREDYLPRHLKAISERGATMASAADDGPMTKAARLALAQALVEFPPELGFDGKPVTKSTPISAIDVWNPKPEALSPPPTGDLRMPQQPVLSVQGQQVLSLRGA